MTMKSNLKVQVAVAAVLGALSVGSAVAGSDILKSGNVEQMSQWYGNAGGLQGTDRVMVLGKSSSEGKEVGIAYDKDVAERTNMQRGEATHNEVGVTYDADVAARTNMQRATTPADKATAGIEGSKSN